VPAAISERESAMSGAPIWSEAGGVNYDRLLDLLRETDAERELREEGLAREDEASASLRDQPTYEHHDGPPAADEAHGASPTYEPRREGREQPEFIGGFIGGSLGGVSPTGGPTYGATGSPTYEQDGQGDRLRAFDERRDVAEAVADLLGLRLNSDCTWQPGGHGIRVRIEVEEDSRRWSLRILDGWPTAAPRRSLALHEAFAFAWASRYRKLGRAEATRWHWKMLVEAGIVERPKTKLPALPPDAPPSAVAVWREVEDLIAIRSLDNRDGSSAFPLSAPWLVGWSGGKLRESEAISGKRWLKSHHRLVEVGSAPNHRGGKPTAIWEVVSERPGDAPTRPVPEPES
jgi:hypothetical protein